ncbi:cation transporter [Arthrobacter sp. HLT1-20]
MCASTTEIQPTDADLGLSPVRLDLQGLTCGSCVNKVETLVGRLDGVASASVALVSGGTSILSVTGGISAETVAAAVTAAGYPAAVSAP